jgi:hypothetical protein
MLFGTLYRMSQRFLQCKKMTKAAFGERVPAFFNCPKMVLSGFGKD